MNLDPHTKALADVLVAIAVRELALTHKANPESDAGKQSGFRAARKIDDNTPEPL